MSTDRAMTDIEAAARNDRRARLVSAGARAYTDPELFAAVDAVLRRAVERGEGAVLLPDLLPDDDEWRLQRGLSFDSHRPLIGPALRFVKRRILLPMTRWLFEYSRENFRRQQRINRLLAAGLEELAIENARLKREIAALQAGSPAEGK